MNLIYGCLSEQGIHRKKNQDALFFDTRRVFQNEICAAVVCDGVGGFPDSEFASGRTVSLIGQWFARCMQEYAGDGAENRKKGRSLKSVCYVYDEMKNGLLECLWSAHKSVSEEAAERKFKAATTVCAMLAAGGFYSIYSTGDSRIYKIGAGMKQMTTDQVVERNGKKVLSNCLGSFPGPDFQRIEGRIQKKKTYLIATDGFYKKVDAAAAVKHFGKAQTSEEMIAALTGFREYAVGMGEKDDSTGIALKFL